MPVLSSWDSGTTKELMDMDAADNPGISAGVPNTRSPTVVGAQPTEKNGSNPGQSASPAVRGDISSSSAAVRAFVKEPGPLPLLPTPPYVEAGIGLHISL